MYAIIKTGGKQYKVEQGDILKVEKLDGEEGNEIQFNEVLMYADGEDITLGQPVIENAMVKAHIVAQGKTKKIIVFKYKRRKGYKRTKGHRQHYTAVKIDAIEV